MKQRLSFLALLVGTVGVGLLPGSPAQAGHRTEPLVSTHWLARHLDRSDLVVVDIRSSEEYAAGHIPKSVSIPFGMPVSAWISMKDNLLLEVPENAELASTLGAAGISPRSWVVVVNNTESAGVPPSYPRAQTARAAITLQYAGVKDVSILDGGLTKWSREGKTLTTDAVTRAPVTYHGRIDDDIFVSKQYVEGSIGKWRTVLLDARDKDVYDGKLIETYAPRPGHIPSAKSLPAPQIWNEDGTFKSEAELRELAASIVGWRRSNEIIVYCGVGGYASGWWFVLNDILGYRNVKFYDGSAQEWAADPNAPLETSPGVTPPETVPAQP